MLYSMMQASGRGPTYHPHEMRALSVIGERGTFVTKRPLDVFDIDAIVKANIRAKDIRIVLIIRDPRSVLVSRHPAYPRQPFIGFDQSLDVAREGLSFTGPGLLDYIRAVSAVQKRADLSVMTVRYEDLITDPESIRIALSKFIDSPFDLPFSGAYKADVLERPTVISDGQRPVETSRTSVWKLPGNAARVVRQFRLAPALFDALESWKYEADRRWFDELSQQAPEGQDNSRGLIVAFFTRNNHYAQEARRLEASIKRYNLPLSLVGISNDENWLANTRYKTQFMIEARKQHRGPLLHVDADAVFHGDPWPYLNGLDCDVAFSVFPDGIARSSTVYLRDTPGALRLLEEWQRKLEQNPGFSNQPPLVDIVRDQRTTADPPYLVQVLPPSLCCIFDRQPLVSEYSAKVSPIIEHLQASREVNKKGTSALKRRHARVDEVERDLFPGFANEVRRNVRRLKRKIVRWARRRLQ
jgi:hypothetical protein